MRVNDRGSGRNIVIGLLICSTFVTARARDGVPLHGARDGGPSILLSNADGASFYTGVVRYEGRGACTGVFLATAQADDPREAPAYVATNGHCPAFPNANDVLINQPGVGRVIFNFFADTQARQVAVAVARVAYATMKGQDLAILELSARYHELVAQGFIPWAPSFRLPLDGEPIAIVGAPGLRDGRPPFLRLAACAAQGRPPLLLEFQWHWFDFDRNRCRDILPGSSGSPVISRLTGAVLGLINTGTTGAPPLTDCALDHPCEVVDGHAASLDATNYATPLAGLAHCFDASRRFNVRAPGCPLDRGELRPGVSFIGPVNPLLTTSPLGAVRRTWNILAGSGAPYYRYKVTRGGEGDCRIGAGYSLPVARIERPVIVDPLPVTEGVWLLCVTASAGPDDTGPLRAVPHPVVVVAQVDRTAPRLPARIEIEEGPEAWRVVFGTLAPEIGLHTFKFGRPGETRCEDPDGYRVVPFPFITLLKRDRPYVFCAIPYDSALNPGRVFEQLIP